MIVNPKTGGNGRYAYLAAWGYVKKKGGTDAQAAEFVGKLFKNTPVLARGGRDATTAFLQRNIGDALITFESEVVSIDREFGTGKVDSVYPSISIVAENPVAVVERTVAKKGTGELAKAYLDWLYSKKRRKSPPSTRCARVRRPCSRSTPRPSSRCSCSRCRSCSAASAKRRRCTSTTAASSTSSTRPAPGK